MTARRYPQWVNCLACGDEYPLGVNGSSLHKCPTCEGVHIPKHRRNVPADSLSLLAFSTAKPHRGRR